MICNPRCGLSWRIFHVHLRRRCILLHLDGISLRYLLTSPTELLQSSDVSRANRNKEREALGKAYKVLEREVTVCFGESQGSNLTSLVAQTVKHLSTMWETWVWSLGWEDSLEKEMATHSSVSCLENPMGRGAWCRLLSMGSQRVGHDWATSLHFLIYLSVRSISSNVSFKTCFLINFLFWWSVHWCKWGVNISYYYCVPVNFSFYVC